MPKLLFALPARDAEEKHRIHKLANSRHAPADWIRRAQMIVLSWQGLRTTAIASRLHCHPQTVRERIRRFNAEGLDGLGGLPGGGRRPRLTENERSTIIALVATSPPGRLTRKHDGALVAENEDKEDKEAHWTLNALAEAAQGRGIAIRRSPRARYRHQTQPGQAYRAGGGVYPGGIPIPGHTAPMQTSSQKMQTSSQKE